MERDTVKTFLDGHLDNVISSFKLSLNSEPILPIRRKRKLRRAPKTPGAPLALKDVLILVLL